MALRKLTRPMAVHIDMTPMVDVMMLLIIFFMMSTTFIAVNPGLAVNLPKAAAAVDQPPENITIAVAGDGEIAMDDKIVSSPDELRQLLAAAAGGQPVVYLKADKDVRHGTVVEVMDEIRRAGISKISVAVDNKGV